ncbi:hypothetical protein CH64_1088 [Yersinia rohdei]|uniref:4-fold beta flower domain-containing protein n=1 Tax=Yersinia rohdei TaxID=29485 RepID=A0A0U1HMY4_YERRO|nr:hypothetical protein [Yersinia rohdei]AJJ11580.1 hypothetical protein CH64_1088 [Yersinia rohdei]CQI87935.1 Uncharacterised protein [Yersinia rohdei]
MTINFYGRTGVPYAYTDDGIHIYTFSGKPIGYFSDDSVYLFNGRHVGYWENGFIRDSRGRALLFTTDSSGGPMKPMVGMTPLKGLKHLMPMKGLKHLKPLKPLFSSSWSTNRAIDVFENR